MSNIGSRYSAQFRAEAVALVKLGDKSVPQIAKDLGVHNQTLYTWVKQADIDAGKAEGLTSEEKEELRTLRRENRTLRMERDILKKAAAFFAKESDGR